MTAIDLDDPNAVVIAAVDACERAGIDALVYGGLALAMFGEPRETRDADLAVSSVTAAAGKAALDAIGVMVTIAFTDMRFGGLTITRLTLLGDGRLNMVDLITPRSARFAAALMARPLHGTLRGKDLAIVSPEDYVLLKVLSTRERDLEDARTVCRALAGRLDEPLMAREAVALAAELPDHDVAGRFRAVVGA